MNQGYMRWHGKRKKERINEEEEELFLALSIAIIFSFLHSYTVSIIQQTMKSKPVQQVLLHVFPVSFIYFCIIPLKEYLFCCPALFSFILTFLL